MQSTVNDIQNDLDNFENEVEVQPTVCWKKKLAAYSGNLLEWYDFSVYGYFSDVIGKVFFPQSGKHVRLALSFTVFGAAFFARPVGSILLGRLGDKYGTKVAIEISILAMGFSSFALGCLPSFHTAGWVAPILLIILRFIQGLTVGGQYMATVIFSLDGTEKKNKAYELAIVSMTGNCGFFIGNMISMLLRKVLSDDQLQDWGWRIPFWLGIIVCVSGFYLKYFVEEETETEVFDDIKHLKEVFSSKCFKPMACFALTMSTGAVSFYVLFTWSVAWMAHILTPRVPDAYLVNAFAFLGCNIIFLPFAGMIVDRVKLVPILVASTFSIGVCVPLIIFLIDKYKSAGVAFSALFIGGCATTFFTPASLLYFQDKFPPENKVTAMSFGYNISVATFGGFAPAIATGLVKVWKIAPGLMAPVTASLSLLGIFLSEKYLKIYDEDLNRDEASIHNESNALLTPLINNEP